MKAKEIFQRQKAGEEVKKWQSRRKCHGNASP